MAFTHIHFNDQTNHGRLLRRALQQLEEGRDNLFDFIATSATMIDGDGSQATHFPEMTSKCGFPNDATAKLAWDELNSLKSKMDKDTSVTNVQAAMLQAFNKFR